MICILQYQMYKYKKYDIFDMQTVAFVIPPLDHCPTNTLRNRHEGAEGTPHLGCTSVHSSCAFPKPSKTWKCQ